MKIPHTINKNVINCYSPSSQTLRLEDERFIALRAANLLWTDSDCESLRDLCLEVIGGNFEKAPLYYELPAADRDQLAEIISTDLPLELVVTLIEDDHYWERRFHAHYEQIVEDDHPESTWKCLYIERHIRQIIETFDPSFEDERDYKSTIELCAPYVHKITLKQLKNTPQPEKQTVRHVNLLPFLSKLYKVCSLDITFGLKNLGLKYDPQFFNVDASAVENVAIGVNNSKQITCLQLYRSNISCEHVKLFVRRLTYNETLTDIQLPHCRIGNEGAKYFGSLLWKMPQLKVLNLRGNRIGPEGAKGLAFALMQPSVCDLLRLDLSLNPIGNEGVVYLGSALIRCNVPTELSIRGIGLEGDISVAFAAILKHNESLRILDVSLNNLGNQTGQVIYESLNENTTLVHMDLRSCNLSETLHRVIKKKLRLNYNIYIADMKRMEALTKDDASLESAAVSKTTKSSGLKFDRSFIIYDMNWDYLS